MGPYKSALRSRACVDRRQCATTLRDRRRTGSGRQSSASTRGRERPSFPFASIVLPTLPDGWPYQSSQGALSQTVSTFWRSNEEKYLSADSEPVALLSWREGCRDASWHHAQTRGADFLPRPGRTCFVILRVLIHLPQVVHFAFREDVAHAQHGRHHGVVLIVVLVHAVTPDQVQRRKARFHLLTDRSHMCSVIIVVDGIGFRLTDHAAIEY